MSSQETWTPTDTYPNGKCPTKCNCVDQYWSYCVEGIEPIVDQFEAKLQSDDLLTITPPSKDRLLKAARSAYWEMVGEANGNLQYLDLGLGLPPCMSAFDAVIDSHLTHFDEMKLERLTAQFQLPVDEDDNEDDNEDPVDDDNDKEDDEDVIDLMTADEIDDDDDNKENKKDGAIDLMATYGGSDDDEATLEMMSVSDERYHDGATLHQPKIFRQSTLEVAFRNNKKQKTSC